MEGIICRCSAPLARISQSSGSALLHLTNTTCEPSGEIEASRPSSLSWRGLPPNMDTTHRPRFLAAVGVHDASSWVLSGNQARNAILTFLGTVKGCISAVDSNRRYAPV